MKVNAKVRKAVYKLVESCIEKDSVNEKKVLGAVEQLQKLPRSMMFVYLTEFYKILKKRINDSTLLVESVVGLSDKTLDEIGDIVKKDFRVVAVTSSINPAILGGLKVTIGDTVFDSSIKRNLMQLKEGEHV